MPEVLEYFADSGVRPGFPGNHGPGWYLVDYEERTIRPKPLEVVDTLPVEETPIELSLNANNEGLQQGGVIPEGAMAIVGESEPENVTVPEGATISPIAEPEEQPVEEVAESTPSE